MDSNKVKELYLAGKIDLNNIDYCIEGPSEELFFSCCEKENLDPEDFLRCNFGDDKINGKDYRWIRYARKDKGI